MSRSDQDRRQAVEAGVRAEDRVADWYTSKGWRVLARRWTGGGGELDLVVERGGQLRFVEVKLRAWDDPAGWEVFTPSKMGRVRRAAEAWLVGWSEPFAACTLSAALVTHGFEPNSGAPDDWQIDVIDDAA